MWIGRRLLVVAKEGLGWRCNQPRDASGVCLVYLIALSFGVDGKSLIWLLFGGAASGGLGALTIVFLRKWTRLKEDAVLGIVLSVYFAIGTALLRMIQKLPEGNSAGLEGFIFGKTALMVTEDVVGDRDRLRHRDLANAAAPQRTEAPLLRYQSGQSARLANDWT